MPEKKFRNTALFIHAPHGQPMNGITVATERRFRKMCERILYMRSGNLEIADVTFLTYNNQNRKTLIERSYDRWGIRNYEVLARDYHPWDWMAKIESVYKFLISSRRKTELFVATDARDVLLRRAPTQIIKLFEGYACDILFCSTVADHPPNPVYRKFEKSVYPRTRYHGHLSAGAYMGKSKEAALFLGKILKLYKKHAPESMYKNRFDDQLIWRHMHKKYYPKIKIDWQCKIFSRYDEFFSKK